MEQPRKAVVVTGFGPFGEHTVNASWIAVQEQLSSCCQSPERSFAWS
uniref:Pyroglutamyl-peptidase I n=1 Tax=Rousettus aegyptiacus TaxID=9407 RepID=A0A7J8BU32_ROUAE|nr:pyroglutamyl-peptidase I [Rousettus aegyptiacus]